jgi:hypothetical protein
MMQQLTPVKLQRLPLPFPTEAHMTAQEAALALPKSTDIKEGSQEHPRARLHAYFQTSPTPTLNSTLLPATSTTHKCIHSPRFSMRMGLQSTL